MYLTPHEVCENCIFEFESYNTSCYNNTNICTCFIKYPFNLILRFPVMSYGFYYFGNAIIIQKISQVVKTFQQKVFHLLLLSSYYLHICKQVRVAYLRLSFYTDILIFSLIYFLEIVFPYMSQTRIDPHDPCSFNFLNFKIKVTGGLERGLRG